MSDQARREISRLLTDRLSDLPDEIDTRGFICGCFREDLRIHDGVVWAYDRRYGGFHSPFEPHPPDESAPAYFRWWTWGSR